jgi:hypothetical protein
LTDRYINKKTGEVKIYMTLPWVKTYRQIKQRVSDKKHVSYPFYGAKGIKLLITKDELRQLWFRDKASEMRRPTIDRIDKNGHYEISNCRYLELSENARRAAFSDLCRKKIHKMEGDNVYINSNGYRCCRTCMKSYWRTLTVHGIGKLPVKHSEEQRKKWRIASLKYKAKLKAGRK